MNASETTRPDRPVRFPFLNRRQADGPRRVLVYSVGEIMGDGVIRLPFVAALRRVFPDARIVWLSEGDTVLASALRDFTRQAIDEFHRLDDVAPDGKPGPFFEQHFDVVIDTQLKRRKTLWLRGATRHRTFISGTWKYLFSTRRPWLGLRRPAPVIDYFFVLISLAAKRPVPFEPVPLPDPVWEAEARRLLPDGAQYVGFVPGSGDPAKRWPLERFIALAREQVAAGRVPVFILGPNETEMEHPVREAVPEARFPLQEAVNPHPALTMALGARLRGTLAGDCGGAHLIAEGGRPLVILYRSHGVRKKFTPRTARVVALSPEDFSGQEWAPGDIPLPGVRSALESVLADPALAWPAS
ncbi:glycosyltransferase family 9 protein [Phaeovibrio sulfidiphilus]|uniref:Glycosyltransferase family 9 protein n=1 Tax=Phaeovibrio sulfidiphilus TaxID=1220600 RepID=A0A8J6YYG4_9PROT|nr:glycosyltransferase family 9 protein [Phaeovibrio sulfidiphilus]MBE1237932.1 glycosyltransferase family 9 protein [Phaeovibrio sulfidiphilus]